LDWIVLKCLEKDRTRRYATANALAMEIGRYLQEEPVLALPPSQWYRLQKLVRRNRMVFLSGAAGVAMLLLGCIISSWFLIQERQARKSAVAARKEAETAHAKDAQLGREVESRETVKKAGVLVTQNQYDQADELLAQIPLEKPSLETEALLRTLGDWNAIHGRWQRAVDRFVLLVKLNSLDATGITLDHFRLGAALIESGERDEYERLRQEIVSRFGSTTSSLPDRLIKCGLMLPANRQLLQGLQTAGDAAEKELAGGPDFREPWTLSALALLEYRRGNDARATNLCSSCLGSLGKNGPPGALANAIQALAYGRLHQDGAAFAALSQAQEQIDLAFKKGLRLNPNNDLENWFDWVLARFLLRECQEQLLTSDRSLRQHH
jgi:hypothetical protein